MMKVSKTAAEPSPNLFARALGPTALEGLAVDVSMEPLPRRAPSSPDRVARVSHDVSPAHRAKKANPNKRRRPNLVVDVALANREALRRKSVETVAQAYACEQGLEVDVEKANALAAQASKDACIVAASLLKSARQMRHKGEAEACARRAAKLLEEVPSPPRLQADAETALGELLATSGRFAEATVRYTTALALREACARDLGSDEARLAVATALTNLATTLHAVGDDKAVSLLRRSCAIKFEVLGGDDPRVAKALLRLATAVASDGPVAAFSKKRSPKSKRPVAVAEARKLRERAVAILTQRLGADHADVRKARAKLAST